MSDGRPRSRLTALGLCLLLATGVRAHGFLPAQLDVEEHAPGRYFVHWQVYDEAELAEALATGPLRVAFPAHCERTPFAKLPGAGYSHLHCTSPPTLRGFAVQVQGLSGTLTEVVATVRLLDGTRHHEILQAGNDTLAIGARPDRLRQATGFFREGVDHILGGIDHLAFLCVLVLLFTSWRKRIETITAFTLGHSITLALSVLGWLRPPMGPIELLIAWTVLFAAYEAVDAQRARTADGTALRRSITQRRPWLVSGAFGLIHGFGFAAALRELGIDGNQLTVPLAAFNVGVEAGQLLILAAAFVSAAAWRRLAGERAMAGAVAHAVPYAVGCISVYWVLQRAAPLVIGG